MLSARNGILGHGANGIVFLVSYEGEKCALKIGVSERQSESFERERHILETLAGAGGAPRALAYCPEMPALLMSFCHGKTLDELLSGSSHLSDWDYLNIALLLCEALQEIHQAGVIHVDLKSDNVIIETSESGYPVGVRVIDFGHAVFVGGRFPATAASSHKRWYCDCFFSGRAMTPACDV